MPSPKGSLPASSDTEVLGSIFTYFTNFSDEKRVQFFTGNTATAPDKMEPIRRILVKRASIVVMDPVADAATVYVVIDGHGS